MMLASRLFLPVERISGLSWSISSSIPLHSPSDKDSVVGRWVQSTQHPVHVLQPGCHGPKLQTSAGCLQQEHSWWEQPWSSQMFPELKQIKTCHCHFTSHCFLQKMCMNSPSVGFCLCWSPAMSFATETTPSSALSPSTWPAHLICGPTNRCDICWAELSIKLIHMKLYCIYKEECTIFLLK